MPRRVGQAGGGIAMSQPKYDEHPMWPALLRLYVAARRAWATMPGLRDAAVLFGMDERTYCDRYAYSPARLGVLRWTDSSAGPDQDLTPGHLAAAFATAGHYLEREAGG